MNPRVTFGMIVLNGEPFVRYNLRALYPFAHEIIVVEGACPSAMCVADKEGHSADDTLDSIRDFMAHEDAEGKVSLVLAEGEGHPSGQWSEKDEMSQAYARRATGSFLWQIDVDEFYLPEDMERVFRLLADPNAPTAVSFEVRTFWGSPEVLVDGTYLRGDAGEFHRLFAWGPGYSYATHRPPTVLTPDGRDTRSGHWVRGRELAKQRLFLYHYELLFPKQVAEKCAYYAGADWTDFGASASWAEENFFKLGNPFRVHMVYAYPSWLERWGGAHPPAVREMWDAVLRAHHPGVTVRDHSDVDELLRSPSYRMRRTMLKASIPVRRVAQRWRRVLFEWLRRTPARPVLRRLRSVWHRAQTAAAVSADYRPAKKEDLRGALEHAWKGAAVADGQAGLVERELLELAGGRPPRVFSVFGEAIAATGLSRGLVAEVGCGVAHYAEVLHRLAGPGFTYVGLDYSLPMLQHARRTSRGARHVVADATRLPLRDSACDILVSGGVLLHVLDFESAILESARVARTWVIFHRTPVDEGPTRFFRKKAYGVECPEIHFNLPGFIGALRSAGLEPLRTFEISKGNVTILCRKVGLSVGA